jgi:integrase
MLSGLANSESFDALLTCSPHAVPATSDPTPVINENVSTARDKNPGTLPPRAVDGFKEKTLSRKRHQEGQLLKLKHGWAVRYYESGEGQRLRVQKFLGDFEELPTRRSALTRMQSELTAVNKNLTVLPRTTTTFRVFAKQWITECEKRKQKPIKASVSHNWRCILRNHLYPLIGEIPLSDVGNRTMRSLVERLAAKKLSPATIRNICLVVKQVKASAIDDDGNALFPTKWNRRFIDMPAVNEAQQRKPSFTAGQVTEIVKAATGRLQMAAILFAASGLRAGELLGLEVKHFDGASVRVEQAVWGGDGKVYGPKTQNAYRVVDLHPDVASLLKAYIGNRVSGFIFETSSGRPVTQTNILRRELHPLIEQLGIGKRGFHSFRRFRNTFLRQSHCPDALLKFWLGHSGHDMSDLYDRSREDLQYRRDVATAMGVGFELPKTLAPKRPKEAEAVISGVNGRQPAMAQKEDALANTR